MKSYSGHYVLRIGDSYYAGMKPIMRQEKYSVPVERPRNPKVPKYVGEKVNLPRWSWRTVRTETKIREVPSGEFICDWTNDIEKAKPFRDRTKALAKAKEITSDMKLNRLKVHVEFIEKEKL